MSAEKNVRGARPGNQNAKKEGATASAHINIRTRPEAKIKYRLQAEREGMSLTDWIHHHLGQACENTSNREGS